MCVSKNMRPEEFNEYLNTLILAAKAENSESVRAYEKIFEAVKPFIYKHGWQVMRQYMLNNSQQEEQGLKIEWEEHMQNLFIKIYECAKRFEVSKNTKFTYYVIVCIRNYFRSYSQKLCKMLTREQSMEFMESMGKNIDTEEKCSEAINIMLQNVFASSEEGPEEKYINNELKDKLASALKKLNDEQKRFIYYHYTQEMQLTQIANILGKSYPAMRCLKIKALEILRNNLNL